MVSSLIAAVVLPAPFQVLVFSKTAGFRHDSIETGVQCVKSLGESNNFQVDHTEDSATFNAENLKKYQVVIFLNTTQDVLNDEQQTHFEKYIQNGNGFVGVHAAADTEYDWPFYAELVGALFLSHPAIQKATVNVLDSKHISTKHLPKTWERTDEWYDYKAAPAPGVKILCSLDTNSYSGHKMGENHPIAWYHNYKGGRAWYTGMGHTKETYAEDNFKKHLLGGIYWAANKKLPDSK